MARKTDAEKEVEKLEEKAGYEVLGVFVNGVCVREYSVEVHGLVAKDAADSYAGKLGGVVKKLR